MWCTFILEALGTNHTVCFKLLEQCASTCACFQMSHITSGTVEALKSGCLLCKGTSFVLKSKGLLFFKLYNMGISKSCEKTLFCHLIVACT